MLYRIPIYLIHDIIICGIRFVSGRRVEGNAPYHSAGLVSGRRDEGNAPYQCEKDGGRADFLPVAGNMI